MNFFTLRDGDRIRLADLDARCVFCTDRKCSFEFFDDTEPYICRIIGWVDVSWVSHAAYGDTAHLRLCLDRPLATLDRARQIRVDLYVRLGIPVQTQFKHTLINSTRCIDLIDDRYCISSGHGDPLPEDQSLFDLFGHDDKDQVGEP